MAVQCAAICVYHYNTILFTRDMHEACTIFGKLYHQILELGVWVVAVSVVFSSSSPEYILSNEVVPASFTDSIV